MCNILNIKELSVVRNKFLCCVPVKNIDIKNFLKDITWENQNQLLQNTINNPLVIRHPLKLSYQRQFLKTVIDILESCQIEVHNSIYESYCKLLSVVDTESDSGNSSYKHYVSDEKVITLKEADCFISQGTTGLSCWQASLALSEWCLSNKNFLQGKRVLELGSGTGLAGINLALGCPVASVTLTDCHPAVLKQLCENVSLNFSRKTFVISDFTCEENLKTLDVTCSATRGCEKHSDRETVPQGFELSDITRLDNSRDSDLKTVDAAGDKCAGTVQPTTLNKSSKSEDDLEKYYDLKRVNTVERAIFDNFFEGADNLDKNSKEQPDRNIIPDNTEIFSNTVSDSLLKGNVVENLIHENFYESDFPHEEEDCITFGEEQREKNTSENLLFSQNYNGVEVEILNLPWEDVGRKYSGAPNLVIAADIVYDSTIFTPLCNALKYFLNCDSECRILIACTERNQSTLKEFLELLESQKLRAKEIDSVAPKYFTWSQEVPVRFFFISSQ